MNALNILAHFRVDLATYKLVGEADYWWDFVSKGRDVKTITLEELEWLCYERFFNETAKANKVVEFMNLKQDNMTVR